MSLPGVAVLVVDDDRETVEILTAVLRQAGALVIPCHRAEDALAYCHFVRPGAVVTDTMMPGRDGYGLLREVKFHRPGWVYEENVDGWRFRMAA